MKIKSCIFSIGSLLISFSPAGEVRSWTDDRGRKVDAELVRIDSDKAILKLGNKTEASFEIAKLSAEDQEYVKAFGKKSSNKGAKPEEKLNFDAPWPERVTFSEDPEVSTIEENAETKKFIYESANYRYTCDVRLSKSVVKGFAVMFEATHLYCRTLPLALNEPPKDGVKHQILLFEKFINYVRAGGWPGSAGIFLNGKKLVLVPLDSLGVKPVGSGYMFDRDKSSSTLPHELTHQLTPNYYYEKGACGWFSEGIAEYVAVTPYRAGAYHVRGNQKDFFEAVTAYGEKNQGYALGEKIELPALKKYMLQDYRDFTANSSVNYGCGLLITNYFIHKDGDGDAKRLKSFLKALRDGKHNEAALEFLLDGRTFKQLEADISKALKSDGIELTFGAE